MKAKIQAIHPVLGSKDVKDSIQFFGRLGFTVVFQDDPADPKYAVLQRDGVTLNVQWADDQQWAYPVDRPAYRILVSDVDALYQEFQESGAVNTESGQGSPWAAPSDTPWGTREFHLRDPGQHSLQFCQSAPKQA